MGGNVARIIEGTFTILILAWVLTHATEFGTVTGSLSQAYTSGVGALMPKDRT